MVETINRGPNVSVGSLMDGRVEVMDGPTVQYQGDCVPDPRYTPAAKDGINPGRIPGFYFSPQFIVVDSIPSVTNTSSIAAAQTPSTTAGVALTLVTAVAGTAQNVPVWSPGVPIVPFLGTAVVTVGAIDFGFATGNTAANSTTVSNLLDQSIFSIGQWIVIPGAGSGSANNVPLITQVAAYSTNTTVMFLANQALTALTNTPIGQGNLYATLQPSSPGASIGPVAASAFAAEPYQVAGLAKVLDPRQAVARNVQIASVSTTSGTGSFLVTGYDVYGNLMHELITATGTPGGIGKKCFKYIQSIATQTAGTTGVPSNVGVGPGNRIGFAFRSNKWEYLDIFWNGGFTISNNGWTAAALGTANNTSIDVRGFQDVSSAVVGSTAGTAALVGFNGVNRVTVNMALEQQSLLQATPLNQTSLFGWPQA